MIILAQGKSGKAHNKSGKAHPSSPQLKIANEKGKFVSPDSSQITVRAVAMLAARRRRKCIEAVEVIALLPGL